MPLSRWLTCLAVCLTATVSPGAFAALASPASSASAAVPKATAAALTIPITRLAGELENLTAAELSTMFHDHEITSVELTKAYIQRIDALNPIVNAVEALNPDALKEAAHMDQLYAKGIDLGPDMGLPALFKSIINVKGMPATSGIWGDRNAYPLQDAGSVQLARSRGVVVLGKTNTNGWAYHFSTDGYSDYNDNVKDPVSLTGGVTGSSTGSAVSGRLALSALDFSEEGDGSTITPAAQQDIFGLRPTYGLVPDDGISPGNNWNDTVGFMGRSVEDIAYALQAAAGHTASGDAWMKEFTAFGGMTPQQLIVGEPSTTPDYLAALNPNFLKGKRIGYNGTVPAAVQNALTAAGAILVPRPVITGGPSQIYSNAVQHYAIDKYQQESFGPDFPYQTAQDIISGSEAHSNFAVRHNDQSMGPVAATPYDAATGQAFGASYLAMRQGLQSLENRMLENDTPGDPSDDFTAIIGCNHNMGPSTTCNNGNGTNTVYAGTPEMVVNPGGPSNAIYISAGAFQETNILGIAYVLERALGKAVTPETTSNVTKNYYRCAEPSVIPDGVADCNPGYAQAMAIAGHQSPALNFNLETATVSGLRSRLAAGTLTSKKLTQAYLTRIGTANPWTDYVRSLNPDALKEAEAADARRKAGKTLGPLDGIPVLLDDFYDVKGEETTAGSEALAGNVATRDSTLVAKLKSEGAVILGKTNVANMGDIPRYAGSGGQYAWSPLGGSMWAPYSNQSNTGPDSAPSAAVSGFAALTVGLETQTAFSDSQIWAGASAGAVVMVPTHGHVTSANMLHLVDELDTPAFDGRSATDAATWLDSVVGPDPADPTTANAPTSTSYAADLDPSWVTGKTFAVVNSAPSSATSVLQSLGATTSSFSSVPAVPAWYGNTAFVQDVNAYLAASPNAPVKNFTDLKNYINANAATANPFNETGYTALDVPANYLDTQAKIDAFNTAVTSARDSAATGLNNTFASNGADVIVANTENSSALVQLAEYAGYPMAAVPISYSTTSPKNTPTDVVLIGKPGHEQDLLDTTAAIETKVPELTPSYSNYADWRSVPYSQYSVGPGELKKPTGGDSGVRP